MSTLRQDPTTRQWVILAPRRAARPHERLREARPPLPERDETCPFCPGNEETTPPEIFRVPSEGAWRVRVVPNLFPALGDDGPADRGGSPMFREMPGVGSHEVVVESPRHDARMDEMATDEAADILRVWRERYDSLLAHPEIRAAVIFKNFGPLAGTSITHPHSQVVATPVYLPRMLQRIDVATTYFNDTGRCVYDDVVAAERDAGVRIVAEVGRFVAFEPFASQFPFETWIAPTVHQASFGRISDEHLPELAEILKRVLSAVRRACSDPDFNLVVFSAPANGEANEIFLWHMRLLPKLTTPAGFELGSAMSINTVPPEEAALALRAAAETPAGP